MWVTCTSLFGPKKLTGLAGGPEWSPQLPLIDLSPFQGSLTHFRRAPKPKTRPILGNIWTFPDPPCQPGQFFWSKMACTCVPHIVLHVSCQTRTSGGYFRPSEVRFRAKIPLNLTSEGQKYPPEVRVRHETCSTICGTPVQAILDQKNLTGLAGGVREGPNIAQNGPRFWLRSPP